MDDLVQEALDEAENDAELYEKAADETGVEFAEDDADDREDFVEIEVEDTDDDSEAISPVDAEEIFDGDEDSEAITPEEVEATPWDDDDDAEPIVIEPADDPTPKDRVNEAASDLQSAFGDLADVVVVSSAPAAFVQPDADAVLDESSHERVAERHDLEMTRFNNREICFEA